MTPAQELLSIAFDEDLETRGVELTINGITVKGLVEDIPPEEMQWLKNQEREMSRVHLKRVTAPEGLEPGDTFEDPSNGFKHRITDITDHPTRPRRIYTCETWDGSGT